MVAAMLPAEMSVILPTRDRETCNLRDAEAECLIWLVELGGNTKWGGKEEDTFILAAVWLHQSYLLSISFGVGSGDWIA